MSQLNLERTPKRQLKRQLPQVVGLRARQGTSGRDQIFVHDATGAKPMCWADLLVLTFMAASPLPWQKCHQVTGECPEERVNLWEETGNWYGCGVDGDGPREEVVKVLDLVMVKELGVKMALDG